jgi:AcrR family transcriptional regulator
MPRASNSLTPEKWADAALDAMAAGGPASVAVEPLARQLGVTKGSFYHHFANREELLAAALARWEDRGTVGVLGRVEGRSPPERLEALFISAMDTAVDPRWGRLLTHLAAHRNDPLIGPVLARVTSRRLDWLTETWEAAGLDRAEAGRRALLAYTAYLGMVQLAASAPDRVPKGDALRAYVQRLVQMLVRQDEGPRRIGASRPG